MSGDPASNIDDRLSEIVDDRMSQFESQLESNRETVANLQNRIEAQQETINSLRERLVAATGGADMVTRRGTLQAGGLLGLLGLGVTSAQGDPAGRIGTENRPLEHLYAHQIGTESQRVDTLNSVLVDSSTVESEVIDTDKLEVNEIGPSDRVETVQAETVTTDSTSTGDLTLEVAEFESDGEGVWQYNTFNASVGDEETVVNELVGGGSFSGCLYLVHGRDDDVDAEFTDLVVKARTVVSVLGSADARNPESRTYGWNGGPNQLTLEMDGGEYDVNVTAVEIQT